MVVFAEIRIQLHVFQEVVHPAHIPFQREPKSSVLRLSRNHRPCGGLLGDHHCPVISSKNNGIQMLEKFDGFQIFIVSVFIRNPLSVSLSVIQVQHGGHGVYTKTVHMAFLHPEERVGDQEVLHFRLAVIVYLCSPVRMFSLPGILMLIHCSAVKIRKPVGVFWKMSRNPIEDHADLVSMQVIYQIFEVLSRSIAGGGRIISRYLVAPGAVERMLRDSHQLYMGVSHFFYIFCQFMSKFPVTVESVGIFLCHGMFPPGAGVYFIDGHGRGFFIKFLTVLEPYGVFPYIVCDIRYPGRGSRSQLRLIGIGIRLVKLFSMHSHNKEFVKIPDLRAGYKSFVHADRTNFCHGIGLFIPVVETSDHGNRLGPGRPHCKVNPFFPSLRGGMGSQLFINIIMCSLAK